MDRSLGQLLDEFDAWARSAPRDHDGWQSSYPQWSSLIGLARERLATGDVTHAAELARVLSISEETEDLAEMLTDSRAGEELLWAIVRTGDASARWQVYVYGGWGPSRRSSALAQGCQDEHPYVARRALLALSDVDPPMAKKAAVRLAASADSHLRSAAKTILNAG